MEEVKRCRRCHRELKDLESRKLGLGKICYNKYTQSKKLYLFNMEVQNEVIAKKRI